MRPPAALAAITRDSDRIGFAMASAPETGSLLRTLAASKPSGRFLELGTGTGVATAWLLDGMDADARVYVVDDLLPQPNWPEEHAPKVPALVAQLQTQAGFESTSLEWSSGLMQLVKR